MKKGYFKHTTFRNFIVAVLITIAAGLSSQAATFTVSKTADTNDGICDADCSLREAAAAANTSVSDDVIEFDPVLFATGQLLILTGGEIFLINRGNLVINGPGTGRLIVTSNRQSRIFGTSNTNSPQFSITLNNLTVAGGSSNNSGSGSNTGGCIFIDGGTVIINNSVIRDCTAGAGGAIYDSLGKLTINSSTINGNTTTGGGGGIAGGGSNATLTINNATITNNTTDGHGGGIDNGFETAILTNVTVAFNSAREEGGGIYNFINTTGINLRNSIVAQNTTSGFGPDFSGTVVSQGYNLLGDISRSTITGNTTGNKIGQNPMLGPLQDNGGPTQTRAPLPGSPAIDAADPNNILPTDERGVPRPLDGDFNGTALPDMGAVENGAKIVSKTADTNDGICDGDCSLREAIAEANASPTTDIIIFSTLFNLPRTIVLGGGQLTIADSTSLVINGPGRDLLTISGNDSSRSFFVGPNSVLTLKQLSIANGNDSVGGAIHSQRGNLTLNSVKFSNNHATGLGGAVNVLNGNLTISDSIFSDNSAGTDGGGFNCDCESSLQLNVSVAGSVFIGNSAGRHGGAVSGGGILTVSDSSFENNRASGFAGAMIIGRSATISHVSFLNNSAQSGAGGAVYSSGTLNISDSDFTGNSAETHAGALYFNEAFLTSTITASRFSMNSAKQNGGAIYNYRNELSFNNSTITGNSAGQSGGGIFFDNAFHGASINNSIISSNTARFGGGIYQSGNSLNVTNSLINDNKAGGTTSDAGGGIYIQTSAVNITNSTLSGNQTAGQGGGVFNGGVLSFESTTIAKNNASIGGGVFNRNVSTVNSYNTLIGSNSSTGTSPDFIGPFNSQGFNLIQNISGTTISGVTTGNITGLDPRLAELSGNRGQIPTHAPLPDSPAIDAGGLSNTVSTDQRGFARPKDGDGDGIARVDIGAFEAQPLFVSTTGDNGPGTLRQAIAVSATQGDVVVFDSNAFSSPQTITLTSGELRVPAGARFAINGGGADKLVLNGNNRGRVLFVDSDAIVFLHGVTITGGNGGGITNFGNGGGIANYGSLTLSNSIVRNNSANGNGGGIGSYAGTLEISNSIIRNNSTPIWSRGGFFLQNSTADIKNSTINANSTGGSGGGIYNISGSLNLINSTISGNTAQNSGGGIENLNPPASNFITIINSTVSRNSTSGPGGGINNMTGGTANLRNTIIANNVGTPADFRGILNSQGYNLIKDTTGTILMGETTGNILGQDPKLDPDLKLNGGITPTHALQTGSPAIDNGSATTPAIFMDQRGLARPYDFSSIPNAAGGNGSDIGAFELQASGISGRVVSDFDGDGKSDQAVWRESNGIWFVSASGPTPYTPYQFGQPGDKIVPGDYDGDGKTDLALYRPNGGLWYLQQSSAGFSVTQWGVSTDIPVSGDFDGDGKTDIAVWRPSTGVWFVRNSGNGQTSATQYGLDGDRLVPGDYDGDGKTDFAVWRQSSGIWFIRKSSGGETAVQFGQPTDKVVPADYDGDGKTDLAVYREGGLSLWYIFPSTASAYTVTQWGTTEDVPVPGDYDGDGKADISVWRPSNGIWFMQRSTSGFLAIQFGQIGDKPVPASYLPSQ